MARSMHIYTIEDVAAMIGENLEKLRVISANSDNIDYGEMVHVHNGRNGKPRSYRKLRGLSFSFPWQFSDPGSRE